MTKTGANTWQATAYQQSAASSSGGFPYSSGPVGTTNLTFDATTGKLSSTPTTLTATVPNGNTVPIDLGATTQLASDFAVTTATADGNAPSKLASVKLSARTAR